MYPDKATPVRAPSIPPSMTDAYLKGTQFRVDSPHHPPIPTVFVVEDDQEAQTSFAALIASLGLRSRTFASAEALLDLKPTDRPACALVDLCLPGMNGLALQRHLVAAGYPVPVVLISGHFTICDAATALKLGVFRIVEKPYHEDELACAIQEAISRDLAVHDNAEQQGRLWNQLRSLGERELRVLKLVLAGQPNKVLAHRLRLSQRTVERIRCSLLLKFDSLSFVELSATLAKAGITDILGSGGETSRQDIGVPACSPFRSID